MRHSMFISAKIHRFRSAPGVVALSVITLAMGLLLALNPPAAHAVDPTLKTLVGIVATALGEPALNDALPLIDCVRKSGPVACVNVKGLAEAEGKKAAKQFTPNDPLIQAAVEIIKAAYAEDWIKVLELTGTDILVQITCKAGLSGGGPLKGFICGGAFPQSVENGQTGRQAGARRREEPDAGQPARLDRGDGSRARVRGRARVPGQG